MKGIWERIQQRFPRLKVLSAREKALLWAVLGVLAWVVFDLALLQPLAGEKKRLRGENARLNTEIQGRQAELAAVTGELKEDAPARHAMEQLKGLRERQSLSQQELRQVLAAVVAVRHPEEILRQILTPYPGLKVVAVAKKGAQPFTLEKEGDRPWGSILRQDLEITFEGGFMACLGYLKRLEEASLRIFWDEFTMETLSPPLNRFRLKLHYLFPDHGKPHA